MSSSTLLNLALTVFLTSTLWGDVGLQIELTTVLTNESAVLNLSMDNPDDEVAAFQLDILFDPDCFTVTGVERTDRSAVMDIFQYSDFGGGIIIAMTGIGHSIAAGTGPVAAISVDVGDRPGQYIFDVTACVVSDPSGAEILCSETDNVIHTTSAMCILSLSTNTVNLGDVRVNTTGNQVVTLTNDGNADGAVTITADGCATADPASIDLAVGASMDIDVGCTPIAEGTCTGTLMIEGCGTPMITVTCNGICPHVNTNGPLDFGDVTVIDTREMTLTITNPGTADLNVSAITIDDNDFCIRSIPAPIPPGGDADVIIAVAPSVAEDGVTAMATIVSDACEGEVTCMLTINKRTPPYVILSVDPACQVIKPNTPFQIQVKIDQVTETYPITGVYFELCTDTCIAHFDSTSVTLETDKSIIDSAGWDIKVHYPDTTCLQVWLIGGEPIIENGCLVNIDLVPNAVCIEDIGWGCGGARTDIWFADATLNEGEPDDRTEDGQVRINEGPEWNRVSFSVLTKEGCHDYGCPPVQHTIVGVDVDGDTMAFTRIPDVNWGTHGWDPSIAPYPVDTVFTMGTDAHECGGASTVEWIFEWCPQKDTLHNAGFSAPFFWADTMVTWSSFTWPGDTVCYDTTVIYWGLDRLRVDIFWEQIESWACADPEPVLWLCPDFWYYSTLGDLPEEIYAIDLTLGYDADCLVPYEVGFEDLDTDSAGGALTYTINEDEATICVSITLNNPLDPTLHCASLLYVGFNLKSEGENAACTTCHYAELSVDHVRINEAGMNACGKDGWIHYRDFTVSGNIHISDPPQPGLPDVMVEIFNDTLCTVNGTPEAAVSTDENGNWGWNPAIGCTDYCFCVSKKDGVPEQTITAQDASMILRSLCNQTTLTHDQQIAADVTCDGHVSAYDAALLLQWVVGFDVDALTCIGQWKFEYVGPEVTYHGLPYVCLSNLTMNHMNEDFEAALVGDVTQNWAAPKVSVSNAPSVNFRGRQMIIQMGSDVYSATLTLCGLTARDVKVTKDLEYAWNAVDGLTRIAVAGTEPVADAVISVTVESGESLELHGNINEIPFATLTHKLPAIPAEYSLLQNYPNPFNPTTMIEYAIPEAVRVNVSVYNTLGQVVAELVDGNQEAGYHSVTWDANTITSGVYFYRIEADSYTATRRMVLIR